MGRQSHKRHPPPGKARHQQQRTGTHTHCPNCEAMNQELRGHCWRCGAALTKEM